MRFYVTMFSQKLHRGKHAILVCPFLFEVAFEINAIKPNVSLLQQYLFYALLLIHPVEAAVKLLP